MLLLHKRKKMTQKSVQRFLAQNSIIPVTLLFLIFFRILTPDVLRISNLVNLLYQIVIISIGAVGMTFALTSGGFDLSVGSIQTLGACIFALLLGRTGMGTAIGITLAASTIWGVINGLLISRLKLQAFVATLATMILFRGAALLITQGRDIDLYDFDSIKVLTVTRIHGIPLPVFFVLFFYTAGYILYRWTVFGVYIRSIGCNAQIARVSGVPVTFTMINVYIITSLTATFAGIILTSQLLFASGKLGTWYETDVISGVVLGGTPLSGGRGRIWGTLFGVMLLGIIKNGLNLLGAGDAAKRLVTGLILLAAFTLNILAENRYRGE